MTSTNSMGTVEVPFGKKKRGGKKRRKREYTVEQAADELLPAPKVKKFAGRIG